MIQVKDPGVEGLDTWCADMLTCKIYGNRLDAVNSLFVRKDGCDRFPAANYVRNHRIGSFTIVDASPGFQEIIVVGAAFEYDRGSGRLFLNFIDFVKRLNLVKNRNGSDWFGKRSARWRATAEKFGGTFDCLKPSIPYKVADQEGSPEKCLEFPSMSLRFLVLFSLRCSWAASERHGRLQEEADRIAFQRVYKGIMAKLPASFGALVRCDWQAQKVGLGWAQSARVWVGRAQRAHDPQ